MAVNKDYYDILGVPRNASAEEIKQAYRKKAREHHPDMVVKEDKEQAEKRFKEINEAYQVLSDPQKKRMYDQFGHAGPGYGAGGPFEGFSGGQWGPFTYTYTTSGGASPFGDFDPFDIFEEVFGFRGFSGSRRPRKGKNLYYEIHLDFADAVRGVEKEISVESGKVKIKIPRGARNGTEIKYPGKGVSGPEGVPAGDLYISLRVPTPPQFERAGDNLLTIVEIDFTQAILGDVIDVFVVDPSKGNALGKAKLKIPSGTQPGTQFRLRGKGMPRLRGSGNGDVIVQIFVKIAGRLSKEQRRILEEYQKTL